VERYRAIQERMLQRSRTCFTAAETQDLRCIVRLAVEFDDYLRHEELDALDPDELEYVAGSVFAGINCFTGAARGYSVLAGAVGTAIGWPMVGALTSPRALAEKYLAMYQEFEALDVNTQFEDKPRSRWSSSTLPRG